MYSSALIKKSARLLEKNEFLLKPHHITYGFTSFLMALVSKPPVSG